MIFCYGGNASAFWAYYAFPKAVETAKRFLRICPDILAEAADLRQRLFGDARVLGVHFRGQEMKTAPGHPVPPTEAQMIERCRALVAAHGIGRIFILSEEQAYVDLLRREFGPMAVASDAFRTYGENAYRLPAPPRERHMYLLGRELLRDTLLLSQAHCLLAGGLGGLAFGSGVSLMAQALNDGAYEAVDLVYNGISEAADGQRGFHDFVRDHFPGGVYRPSL